MLSSSFIFKFSNLSSNSRIIRLCPLCPLKLFLQLIPAVLVIHSHNPCENHIDIEFECKTWPCASWSSHQDVTDPSHCWIASKWFGSTSELTTSHDHKPAAGEKLDEAMDLYNSNLDLLQVKLKEKLSGKRFLLVLDDIWNENYNDWTILRSPFGAGTHIIVTTRLQIVSSIVDPLKAFHLDKLSDDDCLSIFTQHALKARNFDGHLQFKEIGEKIVRRCSGLPLAAKAIGSLLSTVTYHGKWERIYESEIWNLLEEQCGIIPALPLSYHHLPSYLKRCFAYCSILPKDYEFVEEEIILLWRAEGLLQQQAMPQIKDLENQYC
ncbi:putative disease resistance RPP13-like protein 1 [Gossypium raimondii]|uniref:putative disease resistance RPP13-like protein 1 n=1 Tax=Gossypium raimondii TaxID=29730 RepID=UPI00227ABFC0|nr:putative disease resistance RPP13-like protein 1 [Gossypium raimondii]